MCRPDVDQTQRFTQRWNILAPRLRQIVPLAPKYTHHTSTPMRVLFDERVSWGAWSLLARPSRGTIGRTDSPQPEITFARKPSALEALPAELLAMVLRDPALEKQDVMALGLASQPLWPHVLRHIVQDCWAVTAPWAGVEIACTGTYLTDLPEPFAKNDLARSSVETWDGDQTCLARKVNWAAVQQYQEPNEDPEISWRNAFEAQTAAATAAKIPETRLTRMSDELLSMSPRLTSVSLGASWVLRNLTTKQYVRCRPGSEVRKRQGIIDHPDGEWLSVEDALIMRICWTDMNIEVDRLDVSRGQWAGHCFDIIKLPEESADDWKDVTDGIVKEAEQVMRKLYPDRINPYSLRKDPSGKT